MTVTSHNPPEVFPPYRCYAHAIEVSAGLRTLYISGLNGFHTDGKTLPVSFEEQAELIYQHLGMILKSADMGMSNLVSLRVYLADAKDDEANVLMRVKHLGSHRVALTVVCSQLLDPRWKLEMEAVAAK